MFRGLTGERADQVFLVAENVVNASRRTCRNVSFVLPMSHHFLHHATHPNVLATVPSLVSVDACMGLLRKIRYAQNAFLFACHSLHAGLK